MFEEKSNCVKVMVAKLLQLLFFNVPYFGAVSLNVVVIFTGILRAEIEALKCNVRLEKRLVLDTVLAESRKHYGRTVIDRRKVCKTMEIWRKVCQNRDLDEGLDKHFNNKNWDKLLEETVICN